MRAAVIIEPDVDGGNAAPYLDRRRRGGLAGDQRAIRPGQPLFAGKLKDGLSRDPRQRPGTDTRREQLPVAYEEDVARGTLSDEAAAIQEDRLAGAAAPRL